MSTKIEWCNETWNPVLGCSTVSDGCRNCYAMTMAARIANAAQAKAEKNNTYDSLTEVEKRYLSVTKIERGTGKHLPKWNGIIQLIESRLEEPLRWQKPRMVFVNSMSDLFHPDVPFEFVDKVFRVMYAADKHTFQILTKRPERMAEYLSQYERISHPYHDFKMMARNEEGVSGHEGDLLCGDFEWPLPNVWLGSSCENQQTADERIPHLLNCPATVRFLSCEPLLGPVSLRPNIPDLGRDEVASWLEYGCTESRIDWVIVGGESGHGARPMHPDWARSLRNQCVEAGVPFFFKQWGAFLPDGQEESMSEDAWAGIDSEGVRPRLQGIPDYKGWKMPKKHAGRLLDGREWNQMPERPND